MTRPGEFIVHIGRFDYEADGLAMQGWLALPEGQGPFPGVLVFPAAPGLGTQIRTSTEALAKLGYAALGCDLYGDGTFFDDIDDAMALLVALRGRPDGVLRRARGAFDAFIALPAIDRARVASIGYCLGGLSSLELARSGARLAAVVGFHTPLGTRNIDDARNITARILICTGSEDREAGTEARAAFEQEMRHGGVADWRISLYGNVYHSFTNPDADGYGKPDYARYDARAHRRSWNEMCALLDEAFAEGIPA